jgi:hypothetical protein
VGNGPVSWIDPFGSIRLPPTPKDLPPGWKPDPSHRDPNGERWRSPDGEDFLDFHKGRPGETGMKAEDHWHVNGGKHHYSPGDDVPEIPEQAPPEEPQSPGSWWEKPARWVEPFLDPLIIIVNPCYSNPRFPGCPLSCPVPTKSSE